MNARGGCGAASTRREPAVPTGLVVQRGMIDEGSELEETEGEGEEGEEDDDDETPMEAMILK